MRKKQVLEKKRPYYQRSPQKKNVFVCVFVFVFVCVFKKMLPVGFLVDSSGVSLFLWDKRMPCLRRSVKPTTTSRHWQPIFACLGGKGRNLLSESSLIYPTTLPHSRCTSPTKKYWNSDRKQASVTVVFFSNRVVPLIPGTQMTLVFVELLNTPRKNLSKKDFSSNESNMPLQGTESVPSSLRVVRKPRFSESTWVGDVCWRWNYSTHETTGWKG